MRHDVVAGAGVAPIAPSEVRTIAQLRGSIKAQPLNLEIARKCRFKS